MSTGPARSPGGEHVMFYSRFNKSFVLTLRCLHYFVGRNCRVLCVLYSSSKHFGGVAVVPRLRSCNGIGILRVKGRCGVVRGTRRVCGRVYMFGPSGLFMRAGSFSSFGLILPRVGYAGCCVSLNSRTF